MQVVIIFLVLFTLSAFAIIINKKVNDYKQRRLVEYYKKLSEKLREDIFKTDNVYSIYEYKKRKEIEAREYESYILSQKLKLTDDGNEFIKEERDPDE